MSHTKGKVVLDRSIRTAINMAAPPYQHIAMVNITQNKNYTITKEEHEDNARRLLALWNMAEELGLTRRNLADMWYCSLGHVKDLERGKSRFSKYFREKALELLGGVVS